MKLSAVAITSALTIAACASDAAPSPTPTPLSVQQQAAVVGLLDDLATPTLDTPEASFALSNQVLAVGVLVSLPVQPTGRPSGQARALGEECVTDNGNVITYACPGITGTVTVNGDTFTLDLTMTQNLQSGWQSMKVSGTIRVGEGYSNGHLYFEIDTGTMTASMTSDFEAWTAGESSHGWMTFTWSAPGVFGSPYEFVRVVWDGDSFTATRE